MKAIVCCALPYANAPLAGIQIAGAYLPGDIFVRYRRMMGDDIIFLCGSDEYGTPVSITAEKLGVTPKEIVDRYHREHERSFEAMGIQFDIFSRTTYKEHTELVHEIFMRLYKSGYFNEREMISPYCETCARFLPDRYVEGTCPYCGNEKARGDQCDQCGKTLDPTELINPVCAISGDRAEFRETKHLFFRLDMFSEKLAKYISSKSYWRENVRSFSLKFIEEGLKERPITRDINWGVTVPLKGYEDKRIYVWFEALMGYISASIVLSKKRNELDLWRRYWEDPQTKSYYFLGKDNITFHSIIWPSILIADSRFVLPYDIPANENLRMDGQYFSKSRGIGISVDDALARIPRDYLRYYISTILPDTGDSDFSMQDLQERVNSELISKFGNFINRLTSFVSANSIDLHPGVNDMEKMQPALSFIDEYGKLMEGVEFKKAIRRWVDFVQVGNQMFNQLQPWRTQKEDKEKCASDLHILATYGAIMTLSLYPFLPESSQRIWKDHLGCSVPMDSEAMEMLKGGKIQFRISHQGIPFTPFSAVQDNSNGLNLVIAKVKDAREHPNADRLYVLKISMGSEERQIVAGLRSSYSIQELIGKKIVVVANLKRTKIRGEESNGMLLAASNGDRTGVLVPSEDVPEGTQVEIGGDGYNRKGTVEIEDLKKYDLRIRNSGGTNVATAVIGGRVCVLEAGNAKVVPDREMPEGSEIH
ncbi:MAG: methionine--tRNA ligase [Candidatus Thermoplasmatota archaeon]|nr:methionine--tRNA ligase [Candidatus Thermoplasmatota archaeon]